MGASREHPLRDGILIALAVLGPFDAFQGGEDVPQPITHLFFLERCQDESHFMDTQRLEVAPWTRPIPPQHLLEVGGEACGIEVDLEFLQLDAAGGNRQQTDDGCVARVHRTWVSEDERLQSGQGRNKGPDLVVVQLKAALVFKAVDVDVEPNQILKHPNRGGQGVVNG